jgi:RNA polymerase sigma factor (sigma-70 family)
MPDDISHLTAAMAGGDADAVAAFYREYFDWMFIQAKLATRRDESFCLDVVQDAMLRVMRTVRRVESESQLRTWLRLVVQTTAFDQLRGERRRAKREVGSAMCEAFCDCEAEERSAWLAEQMTRLDPLLVRMIELRFEQRWSLRRIGQMLGLSTGAVDGRLRRVLKNLRNAADQDASHAHEAGNHDDGV